MSDEVLKLVWDDEAFQAACAAAIAGCQDLTPLMMDIGEHMVGSTQQRFKDGVSPEGIPWKPLADGSGRTPLNLTGTMRDQIAPESGPTWMQLVASAKQARWHQEGTDPYTILPKEPGGMLSWPGAAHPVRKVDHPGLEARPFMGVSADDGEMIIKLCQAHLMSPFEGE